MPELPEVEVVRSGLDPAVTGATIAGVEVFEPRSLKRHDAATGRFSDLLEGSTSLAAVRRGKFLWFPLSSGRALVAHLGMSGQILLRAPGHAEAGHLRLRLHLDHPTHGELWLNFVDQRIFGSMAVDRLVPTDDAEIAGFSGSATGEWQRSLPSQVAHISRDPLDPAFDDRRFRRALRSRSSAIKRVMLDQTVVSGIGNIYADEALWAARIHAEQPASTLSDARAATLLAEVRAVLRRALAEGGTSFDAQYVNVNGASGYFSHSLNVYGKQGAACPRCGTTIVREAFMNRGSHFCPRCQRVRAATRRGADPR
ncbi:bifunctional DNA-formamidopyrimidine glycosylase/DNA-(apurinic or apyrimidinic site) lyase [Agromyces atrinae]|uniref:bifunctional DNA-formamidopyrimidine glycosylase/DNA-(apurinic or apyrimidinic site) lyase n=1 Tax=Agromyces atrinae TaxID=592376 RepID=UPI001F594E18|nr:bifunctional DNA-formamidopyrimidine glycosylase/DNA-(apurinic or apyrimidinic site) lyase [Agromyces atrinae]MCI2959049.1 bifunctional DNA-formamidopyrimidine glycosylase/DNA-(apurinic or apyrimidinic site) lyase [Agromyces atrinae]